MRRLGLLLAIGALSACTDQLAARQAALDTLVGRTEAEVVQVMGVATQTYEADGVKYLAYHQSRSQFIPASPWYWSGPVPGFYGGFPPRMVTWTCDTVLALVDGRVANYTLRGDGCG